MQAERQTVSTRMVSRFIMGGSNALRHRLTVQFHSTESPSTVITSFLLLHYGKYHSNFNSTTSTNWAGVDISFCMGINAPRLRVKSCWKAEAHPLGTAHYKGAVHLKAVFEPGHNYLTFGTWALNLHILGVYTVGHHETSEEVRSSFFLFRRLSGVSAGHVKGM